MFQKGNQLAKGNPPNKTSFKKGQISSKKGIKLLPKTIEKIREKMKGKKNALGKHWKIKDNSKMKGRIPWNKGKKGLQIAWNKGKKGIHLSPKSEWKKGNKFPIEIEIKRGIAISKGSKGKKFSASHIENLRKSHKGKIGEMSSNWKGGIQYEPYSVDWTNTLKRSIRERDHYICQLCLNYGNAVHHIDYNKKNCNPTNLITLCISCNFKVNGSRDYWENYFKQK
jgi:hypothetical protein